MAMIGNICFALRSIMRKNLTADFKLRTNLTPENDHGVTTIFSAFLTLPFVLYYEVSGSYIFVRVAAFTDAVFNNAR